MRPNYSMEHRAWGLGQLRINKETYGPDPTLLCSCLFFACFLLPWYRSINLPVMKTKILLILIMISVSCAAEAQIMLNVDAHQKKPDKDITFKYISKSLQSGVMLSAIEKSTGETIEISSRDLKNVSSCQRTSIRYGRVNY